MKVSLFNRAIGILGLEVINPDESQKEETNKTSKPEDGKNPASQESAAATETKNNESASAIRQPAPAQEKALPPLPPRRPSTTNRSTYIPSDATPVAVEDDEDHIPVKIPSRALVEMPRHKRAPRITPTLEEAEAELEKFRDHILTNAHCPQELIVLHNGETPKDCAYLQDGTFLQDKASPFSTGIMTVQSHIKKANKSISRHVMVPIQIIDEFNKKYEERLNVQGAKFKKSQQMSGPDSSEIKKKAFGIINDAYKAGATDIHWDTEDTTGFVYFRINSLLVFHNSYKREEFLKILHILHSVATGTITSNYNPKESTEQATIDQGAERVLGLMDPKIKRLRAQFRPVGDGGGSLVTRLNANDDKRNLSLTEIGYVRFQRDMISDAQNAPFGLIITTGPTGSGKSITAKTMLENKAIAITDRVGKERRLAIMTVEDPREYEFAHHIQATSLPGSKNSGEHKDQYKKMIEVLLRSNPNIIFIGEARSGEILMIAYEASETGHLTQTTLHVNDTHSVFVRELGMKVPPFYVFNEKILKLVMSQRLVTVTCPHCCLNWGDERAKITDTVKREVDRVLEGYEDLKQLIRLQNPKGCEHCSPKNSGEKGRTAICELLAPDQKYMLLQEKRDINAAVEHWEESLQGLSYGEQGIYKMIKGLLDPTNLMGQTGLLSLLTRKERIPQIINLCSDGTETVESLVEAGPVPQGQKPEFT